MLFHCNNGCTNAPRCYVYTYIFFLFLYWRRNVFCAVRTKFLYIIQASLSLYPSSLQRRRPKAILNAKVRFITSDDTDWGSTPRWTDYQLQSTYDLCFIFNEVLRLIYVYTFHGATAPSGLGPPHCPGFKITLRHTTLSRTSLDEWSARRRDLYLTTHSTRKRHTSMPSAGFETAFPASKQAAADPRLQPRGYRVRPYIYIYIYICVDFWTRETGTGQQVAQLHDRYMMMMMMMMIYM